jgi:hypothetical protein
MVSDKCPVCEKSAFVSWPKSRLASCGVCSHVWQPDFQQFDYGDNYVKNYADKPTREMAFLRLGFLSAFFLPRGALLDVGAGDGAFVRVARQAGFDAVAHDVVPRADDLPRVTELRGDYSVVTCFDSLEHFANPHEIFALRPVLFVVTIPHRPRDFSDDTAMIWRHYKPDEHLHYFSSRSLELLFHRSGYEIMGAAPVEDAIRKGPTTPNTMTYVFSRKRAT